MTKTTTDRYQLPLFPPASDWTPPDVSSLPSWEHAARICIDVETYDPLLKELGISVRRGGYIVGISFTIEDGVTAYLPIRHQGGDNLPLDQVLNYVKTNAKLFRGVLVGANLSYDLDYLFEEGIEFPNVTYFRDIQIADPLINELHMSYSLQSIAQRYGFAGKDETLLEKAAKEYGVNPKSGMWRLPARFVGAYAEADTKQPLLILRRQERIIDNEDLWDVYNLESRVLPVLVKMRRRGVRINETKLAEIETWSLTQEAEALRKIKHLTGHQIAIGELWKATALAPVLATIGMKLEETKTGKPSIDKDALLSFDHPVAKALAWARKVNKLRTTFAASIKSYMVNGRIHCTFNQIARESENGDQKGARYGRLSSADPNMQQQPARDEFAKMWRSIYIPEEGCLWASCDYSQQEPRWATHYAAICDLPKAKIAAQTYHNDPHVDNHQFMAELTGLPRKHAKSIFLGLCYGEGGAKLCRELGLPTRWALRDKQRLEYFNTKEDALAYRSELGNGYVFETAGESGQTIIDTFDARAPFIRMLAKKCQEKAQRTGCIITGGGRKLHFPQAEDGTYDWTHKALNRLIQGTSADQTKKALVALEEAGYFVQLQVHDEIASSVKTKEEAEEIAEIMRTVMQAEVPFRVDIEIGTSWGESMS
jgi:DNA polymerase I-like protein with 3'-5' exonuclease and polymerase domains